MIKSKVNIFFIISILMAACLTQWLGRQFENNVGDINFNKKTDVQTFRTCSDEYMQYPELGTVYNGGKKNIKKELLPQLKGLQFNKNGLITFRFIVNCKGKPGRFRVKNVDDKIQTTTFDEASLMAMENAIKTLAGWYPERSNDCYYMLNFKIEEGTITDIF